MSSNCFAKQFRNYLVSVVLVLASVFVYAADLTITDTTTMPGTTNVESRVAGVAIKAGQALYKKSTDNKVYLADADLSLEGATTVGIAVCNAQAGQYVVYQKSGEITLGGATMTIGVTYLVSDTAGGIRPISDLNTGDYISVLGTAKSATVLTMVVNNTGVKY